jgi:chromosome segregation ATPase
VEEKIKSLTEALAFETKRREAVERLAVDAFRRRRELEGQLAKHQQAEQALQRQLQAPQRTQRPGELEAQLTENQQAQAKLRRQLAEPDPAAAQTEVERQIKRLAEALAEQTKCRQEAEQQAAEIRQRRSELEAELARVRQQLEVSRQQLHALQASSGAQQEELEARIGELQAAKVEVEQQVERLVEALAEETKCRKTIEQQARETGQRRSELEAELVQTRELLECEYEQQERFKAKQATLEARMKKLRKAKAVADQQVEKQAGELNRQLAENVAERQQWQQLQSELERRLRHQAERLAQSTATTSGLEAEIQNLNRAVEDVRLIHSTLCAQVRELSAQKDQAARRIHELEGQPQVLARTIQAKDRELAALRYAILDAARAGTHLNRERLQLDGQMAEGWKRMMTTVLQTPLIPAQRGMIAEVTCALDGWRKGRAEAGQLQFLVEAPDLRPSEFHCAEVIECALEAVRKNAAETGAKIQTSVGGSVPERARGCPQHLHHLVTTLTRSLMDLAGPENLDLQISFESKPGEPAQMLLSFLLASAQSGEALCLRLRSFADSSAALHALRSEGPELALATAWQLAVAMGGTPSIDTTADREVRVSISLPLPAGSGNP